MTCTTILAIVLPNVQFPADKAQPLLGGGLLQHE